jgi:hypothetical protein
MAWLCLAAVADDASDKPAAKPPSTLDQQLLNDLDNALLEGIDNAPAKTQKSNPEAAAAKKPARSPLDDELLRDLGGEDIGQPDLGADNVRAGATPDPLVPIERKMRNVASRLTDQKLDQETRQLQQSILGDLAVLLQECKKQCQGGGSGSGKSGSKSGKSGKGGQAGTAPATDAARNSSPNLRERPTQRGDTGALTNAMKESWGNLPEHARKHVATVNPDAFLPKYELMLEKYFKRLGEANP